MYKKHLVEIQRNSCHPSWFVSTRIWYALRLQIPAASDVLPMTFPTWDDGTWLVVYFQQNQHQGQGRGCGWRASVSSINHCVTNSWTILQFFPRKQESYLSDNKCFCPVLSPYFRCSTTGFHIFPATTLCLLLFLLGHSHCINKFIFPTPKTKSCKIMSLHRHCNEWNI